jgi:hypothetical protein
VKKPVKKLPLKKNNSTKILALVLLSAVFCGRALAKDGVLWQDYQPNETTPYPVTAKGNPAAEKSLSDDDSPFSIAHPETIDKKTTENSENIASSTTNKPENKPDQGLNAEPEIPPQNNLRTGVILQGLNKITARNSKIEVKLDQPVKFGNLIITLHACWKSPPEESPESKALLEMWEEIPGEVRKKIFSGWMFASSPLISAPEHPIYDITILECNGSLVLANKENNVNQHP